MDVHHLLGVGRGLRGHTKAEACLGVQVSLAGFVNHAGPSLAAALIMLQIPSWGRDTSRHGHYRVESSRVGHRCPQRMGAGAPGCKQKAPGRKGVGPGRLWGQSQQVGLTVVA